ncbi:MAG: N-succinyl-L-ornithine transcarbamylase [Saprospiraceae bacterium]|jgi:N-succinyl-L-ornithine transcarbamylase
MNNFINPRYLTDVNSLVKDAIELKSQGSNNSEIGRGKTMVLLFFNASLRTRISTQIAAEQLGMNVLSLDMSSSWNIETEEGTIMNFDTAEHIKDAAAVLSMYADIIGVRAFAKLEDKALDYSDHLINALHKYCTVPIINLESSIRHPLQSLADMMTIKEHSGSTKPKVVLSWAPHPKALPHAVANSFLEWAQLCNYKVVVTHPEGYQLEADFMEGHILEPDQEKAIENADFIYVKNWSATSNYGKVLNQDEKWMMNKAKLQKANNGHFMHCMPVRRNVVATDEVIDSPDSLMHNQAKNRLHAAKYIIKTILENG